MCIRLGLLKQNPSLNFFFIVILKTSLYYFDIEQTTICIIDIAIFKK